jgi:tetratricopeptide (TPR) repeat protein
MITPQRTGAWLLCLAVGIGTAAVAGSQEFSRIACTVVDENEEPLKGALVTVTSPDLPAFEFSKKTNKRGQCMVNFSDPNISYLFTIELAGYQAVKTRLRPTAGQLDEHVFTLAPIGEAAARTTVVKTEQPAGPMIGSKEAVRYNQGVELQQAGDLDGAKAKFREAAEADPDFAPAYTGIATVAVEQGNYQEAAEAAERAVALEPDDFRALQLRYDAYKNLGDEAKAATAAKALRESGDISEATAQTFREAIEAYEAGDSEVAKLRFHQALELDPELVAAYSNLAQIYMSEGNAARAGAMADEVLGRRPEDLPALKVRYQALHLMGEDDAATSALEAVAAADPTWATSALFEYAQQLFNANQIEEARTMLEQILAVHPDHAESHYVAGLCCNSSGDFDAAKLHFARFLELAPDSEMAPTAREILSYLE